MARMPLFRTSPTIDPLVPPLPSCSVPALMVVPPRVGIIGGEDQSASTGFGQAAGSCKRLVDRERVGGVGDVEAAPRRTPVDGTRGGVVGRAGDLQRPPLKVSAPAAAPRLVGADAHRAAYDRRAAAIDVGARQRQRAGADLNQRAAIPAITPLTSVDRLLPPTVSSLAPNWKRPAPAIDPTVSLLSPAGPVLGEKSARAPLLLVRRRFRPCCCR